MKLSRPGTVSALLAALLLLGASSAVMAQGDGKTSRGSLRGIETFDVLIEDLPDAAQKPGLSTDSLRTDVELRLRQNGIKITDARALQATLYVIVNVVGAAASLDISVGQPVRLVRDQSLFPSAATGTLAVS